MAKSADLYERIHQELWKVAIVDTHEHLPSEEERLKRKNDLFQEFLSHYASSDLISSGMTDGDLEYVRNPEERIEKRWKKFEPYWARIRNTGYARSLDIAARGLFGENGLDAKTYARLAQKMKKASKKGWYRTVLKDKCNIDVSVLNTETYKCDKAFFIPVINPCSFVTCRSPEELQKVEKMRNMSIHTVKDIECALVGYMDEFVKNGAVGIKLPYAYVRPISYDKTPYADAERAFNSIAMSDKNPHICNSMSYQQMKPYQDWIIHRVIQYAEEKGLPVQIHTGLQEGNRNFIRNSDPTLLTNLFVEYPKVNFDIFHASYPFSRHLAVLAKNFRNVYVDMCWFHIMTPSASRSMLHEWLDLVPANKIFAFGGDYCFVEGVYGHAVLAREDVAKVLAERVEDGSLDENAALKVGKMVLRENAFTFFDVEKKRKIRPKKQAR
jgi:predicted TIM-barrel fold metal-dependent hydrolase